MKKKNANVKEKLLNCKPIEVVCLCFDRFQLKFPDFPNRCRRWCVIYNDTKRPTQAHLQGFHVYERERIENELLLGMCQASQTPLQRSRNHSGEREWTFGQIDRLSQSCAKLTFHEQKKIVLEIRLLHKITNPLNSCFEIINWWCFIPRSELCNNLLFIE